MKYLRVKKKKDFRKILTAGKRIYGASLTVVYLPAERTSMAVCVGKKHGKSVKRNRIKRLLREAFRAQTQNGVRPCTFLLIPKIAEEYSYRKFCRDLGYAFKKEKLADG